MRRLLTLVLGLFCVCAQPAGLLQAATANNYKQTNLVSDSPGMAAHTDASLINPLGIAFVAGTPFGISGNNGGRFTLLTSAGVTHELFSVPPPASSSNSAKPTGIVANSSLGFKIGSSASAFIFATEDGTISGWNEAAGSAAVMAVDNSKTGAVYKGLALISNGLGDFLLAANFNSGAVDVFDAKFTPTSLSGSFTDPTLPSGFAPFGIHAVNGMVVVTFAQQNQAKHDPNHAPGAGFVSLFDLNGNFVRRIASQGALNAPWGVVMAPPTFGAFAGNLLVGNFGDGTINAFDFSGGTFRGQLQDSNGALLRNVSLWDLVFDPTGKTGDPNTLYITAGLANVQHGLFAAVTPNATPEAPAPDFSIAATPPTETVPAGQSASYTVTLGGLNGFSSAVNLSCSGEPAGTSCLFTSASVSPPSGGTMTSMLSIATNGNPYRPPAIKMGMMGMLIPLSSLGLLGMVIAESGLRHVGKSKKLLRVAAGGFGFALVLAVFLTASGCGGYNAPPPSGTLRTTYTVMITGTSGAITHSAPVTLIVQ